MVCIIILYPYILSTKSRYCSFIEICGQSPFIRGGCFARILKWSYDSAKKECVQFWYGGCGGNANNFFTLQDCIDSCVE
ncbi:hypothetical protein KR032_004112 [Drosophila birchii]|nr:hypothetical protein KR032_004112 [Drosophila birchii]